MCSSPPVLPSPSTYPLLDHPLIRGRSPVPAAYRPTRSSPLTAPPPRRRTPSPTLPPPASSSSAPGSSESQPTRRSVGSAPPATTHSVPSSRRSTTSTARRLTVLYSLPTAPRQSAFRTSPPASASPAADGKPT